MWSHSANFAACASKGLKRARIRFGLTIAQIMVCNNNYKENRVSAMAVSFRGFRSLVENSPDAISLIDSQGEILYGSPSTSKIFGYQPDEIVGRNCFDLIHPEDRDQLRVALQEALATTARSLQWHARIQHKNGGYCWVESSVSNLLFEPEVRAIVIQQRDINARRVAEEKKTQQAQDLTRSNLRLAEFARTAAHDLREPLTAVIACAEILAQQVGGTEECRQMAAGILQSTNHMAELVDSLLSLASTESVEELRMCDLSDVVSQTKRNLAPMIKATGATITMEHLPVVLSNQINMVRLFQNLIGNALKYRGEAAPEIHITAESHGAGWLIRIADSGLGIAPENRLRVFNPFVRLGEVATNGCGLGLAVCKNIIESLGGTIWVESNVGAGSTFCFTIAGRDGNI